MGRESSDRNTIQQVTRGSDNTNNAASTIQYNNNTMGSIGTIRIKTRQISFRTYHFNTLDQNDSHCTTIFANERQYGNIASTIHNTIGTMKTIHKISSIIKSLAGIKGLFTE